MATRAQMKATRNNAKKSTGQRSKQGKSRVANNALKHGLLARDTVLPGEHPTDFDSQLADLEADIQPANSLEFELVRQIADAQWRMRRLTRLETGFIAAVDDPRRSLPRPLCPCPSPASDRRFKLHHRPHRFPGQWPPGPTHRPLESGRTEPSP